MITMVRRVLRKLWFNVNSFLPLFESILVKDKAGSLSEFPPVFIIGTPRASKVFRIPMPRFHKAVAKATEFQFSPLAVKYQEK